MFESLQVESRDEFPESERPQKRRRLNANSSNDADQATLDVLLNETSKHLGAAVDGLENLSQIGRVLPVFLREEIPEEIRKFNRLKVLGFMKTLSERNNPGEQEALILAWGNVARTCGGDELNIAILELVNYLGNTHHLLCGVAYAELYSLAVEFQCTPAELLKPYWSSVAFEVVKDLIARPQKAQRLSDLLEISVNQLLLMTQVETLPYLVLTKKKDVLKRIASARGPKTTIQDVCMQPRRNLAAILSKLLLHPSANIEATAVDILSEVAPAFADFDLSNLIQTEPVLIACEMLKAAVGQEEEKKKEASMKPSRMLASFLDTHILGIMTFFSDVIDSPKEPHSMSERNRCLGAIEEMIKIAGIQVNIALPQIRACIQSAFDIPQLLKQAFSVWASLLTALDEEDLEPLIDQTFSVVAQHWRSFDDDLQVMAHKMISDLVRDHNDLLKSRVDMLPSLVGVPGLSKIESEIDRFRPKNSVESFQAFTLRCQDENAIVVIQALRELIPFLESNQRFIYDSAISQHPGPAISDICRAILDACTRFAESSSEIPILCAQCLGLIGCLDPSRTETVRARKDILVLSNFERANETIDFVAFFLESVLVKAFHSATNAKLQGFLAHAMQELLKFCGFNQVANYRPRSSQSSPVYQQWMEIPESVRNTLTPFLNSNYPIFHPAVGHGTWLRTFVYDLLRRGKGDNAGMVFPVFARVIRGQDLSIATFLLPFAAVNIILGGTEQEISDVASELLAVLEYEIHGFTARLVECSTNTTQNIFQVLDYMSKWLQEKRRGLTEAKILAARSGREYSGLEEQNAVAQISAIERILHSIPAEVISRRAVECGSYARALFHWEQYMRQLKGGRAAMDIDDPDREIHYQHLQHIYAQIDEPDSIDGISAHLQILDPNQQVLEHRKAGRWTAAQSWYEMLLAEKPCDVDYQYELVNCLRESGQYDSLLAHVATFRNSTAIQIPRILSLAAEASWNTGKWHTLEASLHKTPQLGSQDFNVGVGQALLALRDKDTEGFTASIYALREGVARGLSPSTTASLQACHDHMLKLHVVYEMEAIGGAEHNLGKRREDLLVTLDRRVDILGAYTADKQFILGVRRAVMQLSPREFSKLDIASVWLKSARLARKANLTSTAFDAVLHATRLGEDEAKIEHSRLLWKDGHHRKAIQNLEGAIKAQAFRSHDIMSNNGTDSMAEDPDQLRNKLAARAYLLLAKWLDQAGQTGSDTIIKNYNYAIKFFPRWEKGHYYLGKHYNKQLEGEKALPRSKRSLAANCGDTASLVISSYLRSLSYGSKYLYQTVPKLLTLWLDLGVEVRKEPGPQVTEREIQRLEREGNVAVLRALKLEQTNKQFKKYAIERLPAYIFYTALPQMITRISHPNQQIYDLLSRLIVKVASTYPHQSLWSLLAVVKSTSPDRSSRGVALLAKLRVNLKTLISQAQRLSDALLHACDATVDSRTARVSLSKDLGFSHKLAPCSMVVPVEKTLIASLPATQEVSVRNHKPFNGNITTISQFFDDVLVLSSLQRPRKLTVRGSDGRSYGLLCKPKDDLRKDQRLMEFNAMINRALIRDVESSKRRLDIKTYAVTPLNEECGAIEWVEGLKPMRDIIIKLYRQKGVPIDYNETKILLAEACADVRNLPIFTDRILKTFKPVLYEWFMETFPKPEAWFNARLKYTRTCAVMSIVGHVLGLGDRHGENVLLREENGGVFHVDFNCLFDKGLTFEKPELVPFRLTHNMVDAMGACGVEGPFRLAAELTLTQLRQNIDTLMTILETFLYDPTADFIGKKKRLVPGVPTTPEEVLESVNGKVRGLLRGESVPLSVEGYVDALINQARDPKNLAAMYIGWCAFF
ncbi:putative phosphatidylinositol 3 and 4-kinase [Saccharata proteae CBS 121410]|uniref:non-specific serine/threonine protein kinase n=1 Tax=Saccharata proteae CBS 121410 TaxID=1314787 RepID=A0A9P4HWZ7_9PEZI|nr:putative phosphatidylinositol 3 and 4-kinase [Saccharata proteae CBS 121410]